MARNTKLILTGQPYLVTFRTEQGLPFMPNKLINLIIKGNMAKAQTLYPVTISKFIWLPNHAHLILIPQHPEDFVDFIEYIKRETAHAINRLTGFRKRTIWAQGYDSPAILDFETCKHYCLYVDANAIKASQERKAISYPGVKSYRAKHIETIKRIPRNVLKPTSHTPNWINLARKYARKAEGSYKLITDSDAWMKAYGREKEADRTNAWLDRELKKAERELEGKPVVGKAKLVSSSITRSYKPKRHSPRMLCVSKYPELRRDFLSTYRTLAGKAKKLWDENKELSEGFFAPGGMCGGSLLGSEIGL